jgi:predicted RNase H-like HicB family nuclease
MSNYVIIIEGAEDGDGYSSYAPDLPGVVAAGDTYEECVALMREAVVFHVEGMLADGDPVPEPRVVGSETVPAA